VRNGLPHNYPLLPTAEGREARASLHGQSTLPFDLTAKLPLQVRAVRELGLRLAPTCCALYSPPVFPEHSAAEPAESGFRHEGR